MKLDKYSKALSGIMSLMFWSVFLLALGGIYSIWSESGTLESHLLQTGALLVISLVFSGLAYLTEEEK